MKRNHILALGVAAVLAQTALWHGPLGAADRLAGQIEAAARAELKRQEMFAVSARLERAPLRRKIVLSGPADDFQQRELIRIMNEMPGVSSARWASPARRSSESVK